MANSDVLYKDPIDEVTMAEIRPHMKSAVDEIKDQCDSILEQTGMWADFMGNRRAAQKAALELQKVVQQLEKIQEQMVEKVFILSMFWTWTCKIILFRNNA